MIDFSDQVVLVTGAGAGIGRATAAAFADLGAAVVALEIDAVRAEDLRKQQGDRMLVVHGDGAEGIRVNAVAPETTDSAQVPLDRMIHPSQRHHIPRWIPLGRFGTPEDIAGCVVFLASPMAGWGLRNGPARRGRCACRGGLVPRRPRDVDGYARCTATAPNRRCQTKTERMLVCDLRIPIFSMGRVFSVGKDSIDQQR